MFVLYLCLRGPFQTFKSIENKNIKYALLVIVVFYLLNTSRLFICLFTHSYCFELNDSSCEISSTNYGVKFSSAINKKNIYGTQFHPEKSQSAGIKLIKNFLEI